MGQIMGYAGDLGKKKLGLLILWKQAITNCTDTKATAQIFLHKLYEEITTFKLWTYFKLF